MRFCRNAITMEQCQWIGSMQSEKKEMHVGNFHLEGQRVCYLRMCVCVCEKRNMQRMTSMIQMKNASGRTGQFIIKSLHSTGNRGWPRFTWTFVNALCIKLANLSWMYSYTVACRIWLSIGRDPLNSMRSKSHSEIHINLTFLRMIIIFILHGIQHFSWFTPVKPRNWPLVSTKAGRTISKRVRANQVRNKI